MTDLESVTAVLRNFVDRLKRLFEERDGINSDIKDVFAEAKAVGFDAPMLRVAIKRSEMDPEKLREADGILETYEAALGTGAFAGVEQELVECADGVHRPASEVHLLELLTQGPEIWRQDADGSHLIDVVEAVEALMDQRAAINGRIRLILKMAEQTGLHPKGIRTIVAQRAMDPDKRIHMEGVVAAYRHVMGIEGPTGRVMLPPPPAPGAIAAPKKLTAKEKQFREVMAITIATQSFSTTH
jgi:uncharacterized protein (UPF0335 family)